MSDATKIDFTTLEGVPTIRVEASLTTRAQVTAMTEQLAKLAQVLPDAKTRKRTKKPRATRIPETAQAKL